MQVVEAGVDVEEDDPRVFLGERPLDPVEGFVVLVERDGEYKISLRESVPPEIRRTLLGQYQRMRTRNQRAGASQ